MVNYVQPRLRGQIRANAGRGRSNCDLDISAITREKHFYQLGQRSGESLASNQKRTLCLIPDNVVKLQCENSKYT